jgi:hypothetical protein
MRSMHTLWEMPRRADMCACANHTRNPLRLHERMQSAWLCTHPLVLSTSRGQRAQDTHHTSAMTV